MPTVKQAHQWWQYEPAGQKIIDFLSKTQSAGVEWNQEVDESSCDQADSSQIDKLLDANHKLLWDLSRFGDPSNPSSRIKGFPVQFIQDVCRNAFCKDHEFADFNQALTCIDYLRDLECTRREALRDTTFRLGINRENWRTILADEPEAYQWVSSVQKEELAIESLYAATFLNLRIWVSMAMMTGIHEY